MYKNPSPGPLARRPCGALEGQGRGETGPAPLRGELVQWPIGIREVAGIEHLDTRVVLAVEWRHRSRTARADRIMWRVEPQSEMESMHRPRRGVRLGIRNRAVVQHGRRGRAGRHQEGLLIEAP